MNSKYALKDWLQKTKPYQGPKNLKSVWQLANSFIPFFGLWTLAHFALNISFWLMLPITLFAALFVVRIFIIQHDCGHGSFFKNRKLQDEVGFICGIISLTAYEDWKIDHAIHHAHSGDLDHRDIGEIPTLTVEEYLHLSRWGKLKYRCLRNPIVLFLIAPFLLFAIRQRFPKLHNKKSLKAHLSVLQTNAAIFAIALWASWLVGWQNFLLIQIPITYFASCFGVWLFYVQHQFEDGYWFHKPEWNLVQSALHGSSYFKLPKVLQWFSGNIGFHHIHHLSPLIPNYALEQCHTDNPEFEIEVTTLTLKNCWQTMKLRFWDEKEQRLVSHRDIKKYYRPQIVAIQNTLQQMRMKQKMLGAEVLSLREKLAQYIKEHQDSKDIRYHLIQNQLKTLKSHIKRRSCKRKEQLVLYGQELEQIKRSIEKYFPQIT